MRALGRPPRGHDLTGHGDRAGRSHTVSMSLVRIALFSNALFSACTGLFAALAPGLVGAWLGAPELEEVRGVGIVLVVFAAVVAAVARPRVVRPIPVMLISAADAAWVLGTPALLLMVPELFNSTGHALMFAVAGVVAACATGQLVGLARQYAHPERNGPYTHRVCIEVRADAPADALWNVIGDLGSIADHSPDLQSSTLVQGDEAGLGSARRCVDQQGKGWTEVCTAWEPGRAFTLRFDADAPDFPFPFRALVGGWIVEPAEDGARVRIWWDLVPNTRFGGGLLVAVMAAGVRRSMGGLVATMAAAANSTSGAQPAEPTRRFGAVAC